MVQDENPDQISRVTRYGVTRYGWGSDETDLAAFLLNLDFIRKCINEPRRLGSEPD